MTDTLKSQKKENAHKIPYGIFRLKLNNEKFPLQGTNN